MLIFFNTCTQNKLNKVHTRLYIDVWRYCCLFLCVIIHVLHHTLPVMDLLMHCTYRPQYDPAVISYILYLQSSPCIIDLLITIQLQYSPVLELDFVRVLINLKWLILYFINSINLFIVVSQFNNCIQRV